MDRLGQPFDDASAQAFEQCPGHRTADHHGVFVTAQPVDAGFAIRDVAEDAGAFADRRVADEMAVMVVDQLEAVEVDHRQRDFVALPVFALDIEVQRAAIGQAGQAVAAREMLHPAQVPPSDIGAHDGGQAEGQRTHRKNGGGRGKAEIAIGDRGRPRQRENRSEHSHGTKDDRPCAFAFAIPVRTAHHP